MIDLSRNGRCPQRLLLCLATTLLSGCTMLSSSPDKSLLTSTDSVDQAALAQSQARLALEKAHLAERQGKDKQAIRYYEQARLLNAGPNDLTRRLAVLYDRKGDDARARAAYEQALQLQPNDADLMNDFGTFYLHREQWPAAEAWFRRALTAAPTHQRAANNLAMSLAMQNRLGESYQTFSEVVGPAAAYSNLGVLLSRQGRTQEARDHFQRALAMDPTIRAANAFLAQLNQPAPADLHADPAVQPASY